MAVVAAAAAVVVRAAARPLAALAARAAEGGDGVDVTGGVTLTNAGTIQGGLGGGGGGGAVAFSTGSGAGGTGGAGVGGSGGGGGGGSDIPFNSVPMTGANGGSGGQAGSNGPQGTTNYGGGGGGAGGATLGGGGGQAGGTVSPATGFGGTLNASTTVHGLDGATSINATGASGGGGGAPGGAGGAGGGAGSSGGQTTGAGGSSIGGYAIYVTAANSTIINSGTIASGPQQSTAILYAAGADAATLKLQLGSNIVCNVDARAITGATLALDSASGNLNNGAFDVTQIGVKYLGFSQFALTAAAGTTGSSWTLTGTQAGHTPWTIYNGTLIISEDANLGNTASAMTFASDGVTPNAPRALQVTSSFTTDRAVVLNAAGTIDTQDNTLRLDGIVSGTAQGSLTKAGTGTLILNGLNTYTGGTNVSADAARPLRLGT